VGSPTEPAESLFPTKGPPVAPNPEKPPADSAESAAGILKATVDGQPQRDQRPLQHAQVLQRVGGRAIGHVDQRGIDLLRAALRGVAGLLPELAALPSLGSN
jgi:hypothetical protein